MTQIRPRALLSGHTTFRAAAAGPASAEITLYDEIGRYATSAATFRDAAEGIRRQRAETADQLARRRRVRRAGDSQHGRPFPRKVTVTIDGLAASIAALVAMA